jgi:hypothetical protein
MLYYGHSIRGSLLYSMKRHPAVLAVLQQMRVPQGPQAASHYRAMIPRSRYGTSLLTRHHDITCG